MGSGMIFRSCLSLLLAVSAWGQFWGPQFRVMPKSDGSAVGEVQWYGLTGANYLGFVAPNSVPSTIKWKLPTSDAIGALCSDGSANLYFGCVGGASGITTLNSLTAPTQSLSVGVTGTAPNWSASGGNTHILNLPFASTAGVTAGLISNTSFAAFTAKQDAVSASAPIGFASNIISCATCVTGPGSSTVGYVPTWNNTGGTQLATGYLASASNVSNSVVVRDGSAGIVGNIGYFTNLTAYPAIAGTAMLARRGTAGQTDPIHVWADQSGSQLSAIDKDGHFTGRSATASALAANGANCSAGQAAAGVDAAGAAEGCFTPAGGGNVTGAGTTSVGMIPAYTDTTATGIGPGYIPSISASGLTLVYRDVAGNVYGAGGSFTGQVDATNLVIVPGNDVATGVFRRYSSGQANNLLSFQTEGGGALSAINKDGAFTGNAATATALAANGANCSAGQAAAGIDASGAAEGCFTPAGGGDVSGPGSSTTGNYPQYADGTGTLLGTGKAGASTTATASTVVERDSNGASKAWDKGAQVHNVRAYGATGDGSTDDRAAIQSAIDAETYGGVVYLPPGDFALGSTHPTESGCGLVIGNGTTSSYSSQNAITIQGSGGGVGEDFSVGNSTRGATRLKSTTASITKLICVIGPVVKVWIKDVLLDGNDVTATSSYWLHAAESGIERVNMRQFTTGWGIDMTSREKSGTGGWAFYSCGNKFTNFSIGEPSNTAFSGIRLTGVYDSDSSPSPTYHTSCSNVFERFGVSFGTGSGAVGAELAYADNNKFINGGFSTYGGTGKPVNFTKQSDGASGANFPYGNKFISIDSNQSQIYYGTNGDRGNFVLAHTEAEGNADPNLPRLFWITDWGRMELNANSTTGKAIRGVDGNGTEIFSMIRGGDSTNGLEIRSFDEIEFLNGTTSLWMMKSNGVLVPRKPFTVATLPSSQPDGSQVWCTDCISGTSPCASSGGGTAGVMAIAVAVVGGNGWACTTR